MNKLSGKLILILMGLILYILTTISALAAPADCTPREIRQPSGASFMSILRGDEFLNWNETLDGDIIWQANDGFWCYASSVYPEIVAGPSRVGVDPKPDKTYKATDLNLNINNAKSKKAALYKMQSSKDITVKNMNQKALLVLIGFRDIGLADTESDWSKEFFDQSVNSVDRYYNEVSYGKFKFVPATESYGASNDGVIKVSLNYNHPNPGRNSNGSISWGLAQDAMQQAVNYINIPSYDTNSDGYISSDELHFVFVVSGYEYTTGLGLSPSIWGMTVYDDSGFNIGGKTIWNANYGGRFTMQGERYDTTHVSSIGVFCHELGHSLGLPDLYDYTYTSEGVGVYSLMASGAHAAASGGIDGSSPTHFDAYSKAKLGFVTPVVVTNSSNYTLYNSTSPNFNILKVIGSNPDEYFLAENRQFSGYDSGLEYYCKSGGIIIYHIDDALITAMGDDNINDNKYHKGVDVEEADEGALGYSLLDSNIERYKGYNSCYYSQNNATFGSDSLPNSKYYNGVDSKITISVPSDSSNAMDVSVSIGDVITPNPLLYNEVSLPYSSNDSITSTDGLSFNGRPAKGYSFYGTAGQNISVNLNSTEFNPFLYLLDKDKNVLCAANYYGNNASLSYALTYSGTYFIQATQDQAETRFGSFSINVTTDVGPVSILTAGSTNGMQGKEIDIPINISANSGLTNGILDIVYDNSKLIPVSYTNGNILKGIVTVNTSYAPNKIRFVCSDINKLNSEGTLVTVKFRIASDAPDCQSKITLDVRQLKTLDSFYNQIDIPFRVVDGMVYIKNHLNGDVNYDGVIDTQDAMDILLSIAGLKVLPN